MNITRRGFGKFLGTGLLGLVAAPVMAKLPVPVKSEDEVFEDYMKALSGMKLDEPAYLHRKIHWEEIVAKPQHFPPTPHLTSADV